MRTMVVTTATTMMAITDRSACRTRLFTFIIARLRLIKKKEKTRRKEAKRDTRTTWETWDTQETRARVTNWQFKHIVRHSGGTWSAWHFVWIDLYFSNQFNRISVRATKFRTSHNGKSIENWLRRNCFGIIINDRETSARVLGQEQTNVCVCVCDKCKRGRQRCGSSAVAAAVTMWHWRHAAGGRAAGQHSDGDATRHIFHA